MPDNRKHRGQHPADETLFSKSQIPKLQQAVKDLCWLLSRGYAERSSLKLVGDRYRLRNRQRMAVARSSCSRQAAARRQLHRLPEEALEGACLLVDGFNLLITIESALSGGLLLEGADYCYRDMASIHGSYKRVVETEEAILLAGKALDKLGVAEANWLLDRPVSNSGRLRQALLQQASSNGWNWTVDLRNNPDASLRNSPLPAVSSDGVVLDHVAQWFNLAPYVVGHFIADALVLPLGQLARHGTNGVF